MHPGVTAIESESVDQLIDHIAALPYGWHGAGSVPEAVLRAIARHTSGGSIISHSVETGSGKTTLLFSHLSRNHTVFAKDAGNGSITRVRESTLLKPGVVTFVEGPTQITLPRHSFEAKFQLALIDGPHGYPFPDLEYYYLYPSLQPGGLLLIDDIQIPTIRHLFDFVREDEMFRLVEVVHSTAFFRRTDAPTFDPCGDGWWMQNYNTRRGLIEPFGQKVRKAWRRTNRRARSAVKKLLLGGK